MPGIFTNFIVVKVLNLFFPSFQNLKKSIGFFRIQKDLYYLASIIVSFGV